MAYPGPKVHRVSRRKLGRGQYPPISGTMTTVTTTTPVVHLVFSGPVVVRGLINPGVAGLTPVSQTIVSPTAVDVTMSAATTGLAYAFVPSQTTISAANGGAIAPASGTF